MYYSESARWCCDYIGTKQRCCVSWIEREIIRYFWVSFRGLVVYRVFKGCFGWWMFVSMSRTSVSRRRMLCQMTLLYFHYLQSDSSFIRYLLYQMSLHRDLLCVATFLYLFIMWTTTFQQRRDEFGKANFGCRDSTIQFSWISFYYIWWGNVVLFPLESAAKIYRLLFHIKHFAQWSAATTIVAYGMFRNMSVPLLLGKYCSTVSFFLIKTNGLGQEILNRDWELVTCSWSHSFLYILFHIYISFC